MQLFRFSELFVLATSTEIKQSLCFYALGTFQIFSLKIVFNAKRFRRTKTARLNSSTMRHFGILIIAVVDEVFFTVTKEKFISSVLHANYI